MPAAAADTEDWICWCRQLIIVEEEKESGGFGERREEEEKWRRWPPAPDEVSLNLHARREGRVSQPPVLFPVQSRSGGPGAVLLQHRNTQTHAHYIPLDKKEGSREFKLPLLIIIIFLLSSSLQGISSLHFSVSFRPSLGSAAVFGSGRNARLEWGLSISS